MVPLGRVTGVSQVASLRKTARMPQDRLLGRTVVTIPAGAAPEDDGDDDSGAGAQVGCMNVSGGTAWEGGRNALGNAAQGGGRNAQGDAVREGTTQRASGATAPPSGLVGMTAPPSGLAGMTTPPSGLAGATAPPNGLAGTTAPPGGLVAEIQHKHKDVTREQECART